MFQDNHYAYKIRHGLHGVYGFSLHESVYSALSVPEKKFCERALISHLMQCPAQLVGARSRAVAAADALQAGYYRLHRHPLHQAADALQVPVASAPEVHVLHDALFHLQLDAGAASALCLVCMHHYSSSAGFMLVYTVCTSSNSSRRSTILSMVSRCAGSTSFKSLAM